MKPFNADRRTFLQAAGAGLAVSRFSAAQAQNSAAAPVPPPRTAKVTSSVMVWTLKGSFEEKLQVLAKAGIQSAELVTEYLGWSDADLAQYKKALQSYGLTIDMLLSQQDWTKRPVTMVNPSHRDGFLDEVKRAIGWAQKLNAPQIIVMSGNEQPDMTHEAQYSSLVEGGKRAADLAASAGVRLVLEPLNSKINHKGYFLTSAIEGLKAVKEVNNPHFRLLFDIYHEQVQNGNVIRSLTEAEPYVSTFHIADNPGRNDPGTGEMNYENIYKAIAKTGYSGYIALEYLPLADPVDSLTKAVTDMRKALNSVPQS